MTKDHTNVLDDICRGVASDVYRTRQAQRLLEKIDTVVDVVNETGIGRRFLAELQMILQHELILGLTRVYEPYSQRNPGRTLRAATHYIETHVTELPLVNPDHVREFLARHEPPREENPLGNQELSLAVVRHLDTHLPQADPTSTRSLDQALEQVKAVRDKAIAHHDRVDRASLLVPGWSHLMELVAFADEAVTLLASAYLSVNYGADDDAVWTASSLGELLKRGGLADDYQDDSMPHQR